MKTLVLAMWRGGPENSWVWVEMWNEALNYDWWNIYLLALAEADLE